MNYVSQLQTVYWLVPPKKRCGTLRLYVMKLNLICPLCPDKSPQYMARGLCCMVAQKQSVETKKLPKITPVMQDRG